MDKKFNTEKELDLVRLARMCAQSQEETLTDNGDIQSALTALVLRKCADWLEELRPTVEEEDAQVQEGLKALFGVKKNG